MYINLWSGRDELGTSDEPVPSVDDNRRFGSEICRVWIALFQVVEKSIDLFDAFAVQSGVTAYEP